MRDAAGSIRVLVSGHVIGVRFDDIRVGEFFLRLEDLMSIRPYVAEGRDASDAIVWLRFVDGPCPRMTWDSAAMELVVWNPWHDDVVPMFGSSMPFRPIYLYALRLALEIARQRTGEYALHASCVNLDGQGIVFSGPAESGKTTSAIELCRLGGAKLVANDEVVVRLERGRVRVVYGQDRVNLRRSSVMNHDAGLGANLFRGVASSRPWDEKREVSADMVGIESVCSPGLGVKLLVSIRLDSSVEGSAVVYTEPAGSVEKSAAKPEQRFAARVALYQELSSVVRGATFVPLDERSHHVLPMGVPDLDDDGMQIRRSVFVNSVFDGSAGCQFVSLRGPLPYVIEQVKVLLNS